MLRRHHLTLPVLLATVLTPVGGRAQIVDETVDLGVVQRIRQEGFEHSHIPELAHHLTEVIGPRLSGSPAMKRANEWTAQTFREWGLANVRVEPWGEFGRGWEMEAYEGRILTPFEQAMPGVPSAWTGSTDQTVRGQAMTMYAESIDDLARFEGELNGKILLVDQPQEVDVFQDVERRTSLEDLLTPSERERPSMSDADRQRMYARRRAMREVANAAAGMAEREGALALLRISGAADGVIRGGGNGSREAGAPEGLPQVIITREQYNQILRDLEGGAPVEIELNVQNRFYEEDLQQYNTLAEIPGADKADEYVMLGAHLDSWHGGTGATDNAAGCAVALEAVRILKSLDLPHDRTVRLALWGGEEQGLLGSRGYVRRHFGDPVTMELKPEHAHLSGYFNLDNGAGRIRGVYLQGNDMMRPVFDAWFRPFSDMGVDTVSIRNTGGTDHLSFDAVGLPAFQFIQDPLDYFTRTHHSNLDVVDHVEAGDLMQASAVMATVIYEAANREEMLPRKPLPEPLPPGALDAEPTSKR
jgi:carboxypeptidase Q